MYTYVNKVNDKLQMLEKLENLLLVVSKKNSYNQKINSLFNLKRE